MHYHWKKYLDFSVIGDTDCWMREKIEFFLDRFFLIIWRALRSTILSVKFGKYVGDKVVLSIFISLVPAFILYVYQVNQDKIRNRQIDDIRQSLYGQWVIELGIENGSVEELVGVRVRYYLSLSVDRNLDIQGLAYKYWESNKDGSFFYLRENRSNARINGTVIDNEFVLNWVESDRQERESILIVDGLLSTEEAISGNFSSDVQLQSGRFCGKKIYDFSEAVDFIGCQ